MKSSPSATSGVRRDTLLSIAGVLGVASLAWAYLIVSFGHGQASMSMDMMAGPATGAGEATTVVLTVIMWVVMMAAMMLPSVLPMIVAYQETLKVRPSQQWTGLRIAVFGSGYLVVWSSFGLAAAVLQVLLQRGSALTPSMALASTIVGGVFLVAAGGYQWTPLKRACATACRSPIGFLLTEWREGSAGAFGMGLRHGLSCLGCCWVLMGLLFVGGVMNFLWLAAISTFVLAEKSISGRKGELFSRITGLGLVTWGGVVMVSAMI